MYKKILSILILSILAAASAQAKPLAGDVLPDFNLKAPADAVQASYLGVEGRERFNLSEVASPWLLIEVFSMYCPHCQREAPLVNKLFELVGESAVAGKLKAMGIGAGNSDYEVDFFRDKYKVELPLFSDPEYVIHSALGQVGTPYFILCRLNGPGQPVDVVLSNEGPFGDPGEFLGRIMEKMNRYPDAKQEVGQ